MGIFLSCYRVVGKSTKQNSRDDKSNTETTKHEQEQSQPFKSTQPHDAQLGLQHDEHLGSTAAPSSEEVTKKAVTEASLGVSGLTA
jgi:hypothetical protein